MQQQRRLHARQLAHPDRETEVKPGQPARERSQIEQVAEMERRTEERDRRDGNLDEFFVRRRPAIGTNRAQAVADRSKELLPLSLLLFVEPGSEEVVQPRQWADEGRERGYEYDAS